MLEKSIQKYKDEISVIFFIIIGAIFFLVGSNNSFQVNTDFLTNNSFANPTTTLFTLANRTLFSVEYRYLALALLLIIVLKLIYKIYSRYNKSKVNEKKLSKTLDLNLNSFSYAVFMVFICLLTGLQDISTVIFVLISSFIGVRLILSKYEDTNKFEIKKQSIILVSISWVLVVIYSLGTLIYGSVRSPWYVYILDLIGLIYFISIVFNNGYWPIKKLKNEDREFIKYTVNLFLKIVFFVVLIIGIHKLV